MRAVFDTNIYLAALLKKGLASDILDAVAKPGSDFLLFISEDIWKELEDKINEVIQKKSVQPELAAEFRKEIQDVARAVWPTEIIHEVQTDSEDNKILECAVAAEANIIVTMDRDLLKLKQFRNIAIVHPKTFSFMMPKF